MSFKATTSYSLDFYDLSTGYQNHVIVNLFFGKTKHGSIVPCFQINIKGLEPDKSPHIVTKVTEVRTFGTFRDVPHWYGAHLLEQMSYISNGDIRGEAAEKIIYAYFMFCVAFHEELYTEIKKVLPEFIEWFDTFFRPGYLDHFPKVCSEA